MEPERVGYFGGSTSRPTTSAPGNPPDICPLLPLCLTSPSPICLHHHLTSYPSTLYLPLLHYRQVATEVVCLKRTLACSCCCCIRCLDRWLAHVHHNAYGVMGKTPDHSS